MKILYIILLLLTIGSIQAQSFKPMKDHKVFEQKMQEVALQTETLQSDFVQIKHLDVLSEDIESDGYFCFKKKNMLRWEYTDPIEYLIVLKNGKLSIKDEGKVNSFDLTSNKTFQKVNEMVVQSVQGDVLAAGDDYTYAFFESSTQYLVKMQPKEKEVQSFLKGIEIYFSKKDYAVEQVKMLEQSGDYTQIKFKNKKVNAAISDKKFIIN